MDAERWSVEEDGLVRAMLIDPQDELARNAYADWREERGAPHPPARQAFGSRHAILGRLGELLIARMPFDLFISNDFRRDGPAWLRRHFVPLVGLSGMTDPAPLADSPALPGVRGLVLQGGVLRQGFAAAFARMSALAPLSFLGLEYVDASRDDFAAVLTGPALAGLDRLSLAQPEIGARLLEALGDAPLAGRLEHLDLLGAEMGDLGVIALTRSERLMAGLVTLRIEGPLTSRAAVALAECPHLGKLRHLELAEGWIGEEGLGALARSALLPRLRWLSLRGNRYQVGDGHRVLARAIAAVPGLRLGASRGLHDSMLSQMRDILGPRLVEE